MVFSKDMKLATATSLSTVSAETEEHEQEDAGQPGPAGLFASHASASPSSPSSPTHNNVWEAELETRLLAEMRRVTQGYTLLPARPAMTALQAMLRDDASTLPHPEEIKKIVTLLEQLIAELEGFHSSDKNPTDNQREAQRSIAQLVTRVPEGLIAAMQVFQEGGSLTLESSRQEIYWAVEKANAAQEEVHTLGKAFKKVSEFHRNALMSGEYPPLSSTLILAKQLGAALLTLEDRLIADQNAYSTKAQRKTWTDMRDALKDQLVLHPESVEARMSSIVRLHDTLTSGNTPRTQGYHSLSTLVGHIRDTRVQNPRELHAISMLATLALDVESILRHTATGGVRSDIEGAEETATAPAIKQALNVVIEDIDTVSLFLFESGRAGALKNKPLFNAWDLLPTLKGNLSSINVKVTQQTAFYESEQRRVSLETLRETLMSTAEVDPKTSGEWGIDDLITVTGALLSLEGEEDRRNDAALGILAETLGKTANGVLSARVMMSAVPREADNTMPVTAKMLEYAENHAQKGAKQAQTLMISSANQRRGLVVPLLMRDDFKAAAKVLHTARSHLLSETYRQKTTRKLQHQGRKVGHIANKVVSGVSHTQLKHDKWKAAALPWAGSRAQPVAADIQRHLRAGVYSVIEALTVLRMAAESEQESLKFRRQYGSTGRSKDMHYDAASRERYRQASVKAGQAFPWVQEKIAVFVSMLPALGEQLLDAGTTAVVQEFMAEVIPPLAHIDRLSTDWDAARKQQSKEGMSKVIRKIGNIKSAIKKAAELSVGAPQSIYADENKRVRYLGDFLAAEKAKHLAEHPQEGARFDKKVTALLQQHAAELAPAKYGDMAHLLQDAYIAADNNMQLQLPTTEDVVKGMPGFWTKLAGSGPLSLLRRAGRTAVSGTVDMLFILSGAKVVGSITLKSLMFAYSLYKVDSALERARKPWEPADVTTAARWAVTDTLFRQFLFRITKSVLPLGTLKVLLPVGQTVYLLARGDRTALLSEKLTVGKVAEEAGWEGGIKGISLAGNALTDKTRPQRAGRGRRHVIAGGRGSTESEASLPRPTVFSEGNRTGNGLTTRQNDSNNAASTSLSKKFTVGKVAEEAGWEGGSKGVSLAENALGRGSNKSDIVAASDNGEIAKEGVGKNNIVAFKGTDAHITHNGSAESNGNNQTKIDKRSANHATAGGSGSTESEASSPNRVLKRPKRHPLALSKSRARYEQGHAFSFDPQFMGKTIEFTVPRKGGKTDIYTYTMGKGDPKQVVHDMGVWINNTIDGLKFGKLIGPWGPISPEASHSSNYFWQIIESDIIDYHYKYVVEKEGENSKGTSKGENTLAMINKPISKGNEVRNVQRNNNYLSSNAPLPSIYDASDKKTSDESYINLSEGEKKITYLHAINDTLDKIGRDSSIPLHARQNAHRAKIGMPIVTPVDIDGFKMANTFFIPDTTGSKRGVLVNLNAKKKSYIYIRGPSDFPMDLASNFSNNNIEVDGGLGVGFERNDLDESGVLWGVTRSTDKDFEDGFNKENNKPMSIYDLSENLADSVKAKYVNQPNINHNKYVVEKAISGTKIPTPGISVSPATYSLRYKWASLRVSQYLRSVVNPFSTLGGQVQLVVSSINNDSIQDTDETIKKAEYIGSWVDATTGTVISFSPAGIVLNVVQSAAGITADLAESKTPDPLDTAGLVMSCIPGGKISARIGKFSKVGEKGVKYFLLIAEKTLDLAELSRSIKTAVDTGEPLAIYQAFLASGMSVKNAYDMAKNMSSELKLGEMASLEKLEAIHNNTPESSLTSTMQARTFRMGSTEMLGRINNAEIEISMDKGATWVKGSKLHLLTYRLQNAGGGLKFPSWGTGEIVIGEHTFKRVTYSKDKMHEMRKISTSYDTTINVRVEQDYRKGKEMSHATQYDHYNSLSLDEKLDLFNNQSTNALTRGVLAGKINESILKINAYEVAKGADSWRTSANKATKVVLAPQNIFLKGRQGECLPVCVLMGWALQSGQDAKLVKKLMNIPSSASISDNPLYKSLVELHANGNSSKFAARAISDVKMSALSDAESRLFPTENSSVRVDIPAHTMLISKVTKGGKVKYVFYDPNYGLAYFDKYKDMCAFFKKKLEDDYQAENYTTFSHLDYSRLPDVKILGKDLNEIISDTEQPDSGSKQLNAPASGHVQPPSAPASSIARTGVADQPHTDSIQAGGSGKVNQIFQRPSDTKRTEPVKEEQQQSNPKPVQPRNDVQYSYSTKRGQSYYDVLDYYTKQSRYADKQKFYSLNKHNIPKNMPDPDNQALPEGTIFQIPPLLPQPKIAKDDDE